MFRIDTDLTEFEGLASRLTARHRRRVSASLQAAVVDAAEYVRQTWHSAVQGAVLPGMNRQVFDDEYADALASGDALQFPEAFRGVVIARTDKARDYEVGTQPFDMKPGLLQGPKSREVTIRRSLRTARILNPWDSGARYNVVPFRYATPGQGRAGHGFAGRLEPHVYNEVRRTGRITPDSPFAGSPQQRQTAIEGLHYSQGQTVRPGQGSAFVSGTELHAAGQYKHRAGLMSGLTRVVREYEQTRSSQYMTFRTVSTPRWAPRGQKGSDPNSWINPGRAANPIIQSVLTYTRPHVQEFLRKAVQEAISG